MVPILLVGDERLDLLLDSDLQRESWVDLGFHWHRPDPLGYDLVVLTNRDKTLGVSVLPPEVLGLEIRPVSYS